ncbi:hypothetical protein J6590_041968 [Homalodisca vitripennis]|nr:hypothetical protein J6590_041968 [Homalodisca vitripennis]
MFSNLSFLLTLIRYRLRRNLPQTRTAVRAQAPPGRCYSRPAICTIFTPVLSRPRSLQLISASTRKHIDSTLHRRLL